MALTKKQKQELESRLQEHYKVTIWQGDNSELIEYYRVQLRELEQVMLILGYDRDSITRLKNETMQLQDMAIYTAYRELNNIIDQIAGKKTIFLYEYKPNKINSLIDSYDYDARLGQKLHTQMHKIRQAIANKEQMARQIDNMVNNITT